MYVARFFEVNKFIDVVARGKTWQQLMFVLVDAPSEVVSNACVERFGYIG